MIRFSTDREAPEGVQSRNGRTLGRRQIDYRIQEDRCLKPDTRLKPEIVQQEIDKNGDSEIHLTIKFLICTNTEGAETYADLGN